MTGQLYVNLDLLPGYAGPAGARGTAGIPRSRRIPTPLEEATKSLSALLAQLKDADLAGTARSLSSAIEGHQSAGQHAERRARRWRSCRRRWRRFASWCRTSTPAWTSSAQDLQSTLAVRGPRLRRAPARARRRAARGRSGAHAGRVPSAQSRTRSSSEGRGRDDAHASNASSARAAGAAARGGCSFLKARSDPTRYFVLTSERAEKRRRRRPTVVRRRRSRRPARVPDAARAGDALRRRTSSTIAEYDRWGEALKDGFSRTLRRDLENELGAGHVVAAPFDPRAGPTSPSTSRCDASSASAARARCSRPAGPSATERAERPWSRTTRTSAAPVGQRPARHRGRAIDRGGRARPRDRRRGPRAALTVLQRQLINKRDQEIWRFLRGKQPEVFWPLPTKEICLLISDPDGWPHFFRVDNLKPGDFNSALIARTPDRVHWKGNRSANCSQRALEPNPRKSDGVLAIPICVAREM